MRRLQQVGAFLLLLVFMTTSANAQPDRLSENRLSEIRAFVQISDQLGTAGQITYDQIPLLKEHGYEVVINLAPADESRNGLEGFLVVQEGMSYIQIPVSWQNPSTRDLQLFFDVMEANRDRKVFVHCFANMRASAFVYLYRTLKDGIPEDAALVDLGKVWDPSSLDQWDAFMIDAMETQR